MLRIQHAADGRLRPQGDAGGVSKQVPTLRCAHRATGDALLNFLQFVRISEYDLANFLSQDKPENLSCTLIFIFVHGIFGDVPYWYNAGKSSKASQD